MPNDFDQMVPSFSNGQSFGALHSAPDLHEGQGFRAPVQLPHLVNPASGSMELVGPNLSKQMTFSPKPAASALRDFDETPVGPKSKLQKETKTKKKKKKDEEESEQDSDKT